MKHVYKYPFEITEEIVVPMPLGAEILTVQVQRGDPCIWALVNSAAPVVKRCLRLAGTGHPLPDDPGEYIGTFQGLGGDLVFHLFDQGEKSP